MIHDQAFYGVSIDKCVFAGQYLLFIAPHPLFRRFDFKYPLQYKQYAAERAAKQAQSPGFCETQTNHAFWNSAKVQLLLFCTKNIFTHVLIFHHRRAGQSLRMQR